MPLGKGVGLGPGHIVLDGDPGGTQPPQQPLPTFGSCLLWPNGRPSQQLLSSCYVVKCRFCVSCISRCAVQSRPSLTGPVFSVDPFRRVEIGPYICDNSNISELYMCVSAHAWRAKFVLSSRSSIVLVYNNNSNNNLYY